MNYIYEDKNGHGARVTHSPSAARREQYVVNLRYGYRSISTLAIDLEDARRKVRQIFGEGAELVEDKE